jgi:hypothetical protein
LRKTSVTDAGGRCWRPRRRRRRLRGTGEQGEYSGDGEDRVQARNVAREVGRDVYEVGYYGRSQERQDYRDYQRQERYQEAVLYPGAARHPPRRVAPHEKG